MKFGKQLKSQIASRYKFYYVDYHGLKTHLKSHSLNCEYTSNDEDQFIKLLQQELDKVASFQTLKLGEITRRTERCEHTIRQHVDQIKKEKAAATSLSQQPSTSTLSTSQSSSNITLATFLETESEINTITLDLQDLARYQRLNYTAFLKILKKHDKHTGFCLRSQFMIQLNQRPFHKERFQPLVNRLSTLYNIVRTGSEPEVMTKAQSIDSDSESFEDVGGENGEETLVPRTTTFWVHPDNVMDLKMLILKYLPLVVYEPSPSGSLSNGSNTSSSYLAGHLASESPMSTVYLDNPNLDLYMGQVEGDAMVESARLRWYGDDSQKIWVEHQQTFKTAAASNTTASTATANPEALFSTTPPPSKSSSSNNIHNNNASVVALAVADETTALPSPTRSPVVSSSAATAAAEQPSTPITSGLSAGLMRQQQQQQQQQMPSPSSSYNHYQNHHNHQFQPQPEEEDQHTRVIKGRFLIKAKNVPSLLRGDAKMAKHIHQMRVVKVKTEKEIQHFEDMVTNVQNRIHSRQLQPVVQTFFNRTAFQVPSDSRVRITLDSDVAMVREGNLYRRDPQSNYWRRTDLFAKDYPFPQLAPQDIVRFPYVIMQIRTLTYPQESVPGWVDHIGSSHLVEHVPNFTKDLHAIATLFEAQAGLLPFWLSDMDRDIRKVPMSPLYPRRGLDGEETTNSEISNETLNSNRSSGSNNSTVDGLPSRSSLSKGVKKNRGSLLNDKGFFSPPPGVKFQDQVEQEQQQAAHNNNNIGGGSSTSQSDMDVRGLLKKQHSSSSLRSTTSSILSMSTSPTSTSNRQLQGCDKCCPPPSPPSFNSYGSTGNVLGSPLSITSTIGSPLLGGNSYNNHQTIGSLGYVSGGSNHSSFRRKRVTFKSPSQVWWNRLTGLFSPLGSITTTAEESMTGGNGHQQDDQSSETSFDQDEDRFLNGRGTGKLTQGSRCRHGNIVYKSILVSKLPPIEDGSKPSSYLNNSYSFYSASTSLLMRNGYQSRTKFTRTCWIDLFWSAVNWINMVLLFTGLLLALLNLGDNVGNEAASLFLITACMCMGVSIWAHLARMDEPDGYFVEDEEVAALLKFQRTKKGSIENQERYRYELASTDKHQWTRTRLLPSVMCLTLGSVVAMNAYVRMHLIDETSP